MKEYDSIYIKNVTEAKSNILWQKVNQWLHRTEEGLGLEYKEIFRGHVDIKGFCFDCEDSGHGCTNMSKLI